MIFELYRSKDGCTHSYFAKNEGYERNMELLEPESEKIWEIDARSYNQAMQAYYEYMDWGKYKQFGEDIFFD